MTFLVDSWTC